MKPVYVLDALRTPIGRYRGALANVRTDDLAAHVIRRAVARNPKAAERVDHVIFGATNQAGEDNRNVARMALLLAGLPDEVPGVTVNRLCGSGLEAVNGAARMIACEEAEVVIAGGVESMTRAPFTMGKQPEAFDRRAPKVWDTTIGWRYPNPALEDRFPLIGMGETAENVADRYGITREDQDAFALNSQQKAAKAWEEQRFAAEIEAIEVPQRKGDPVRVDKDEAPRPDSSLEKLARLRPVFRKGGSVTAGNSSPINDGSAALMLASEAVVKELGVKPLGRLVRSAVVGVEPNYMGIGPIPATRKLLERTGWQLSDVDLVELNEAFAAQSLACIRELGLDPETVNVNGGALALGHPIGCSGARIAATLLHAMAARKAKRGIAALCIGVGQGIATAFEAWELGRCAALPVAATGFPWGCDPFLAGAALANFRGFFCVCAPNLGTLGIEDEMNSETLLKRGPAMAVRVVRTFGFEAARRLPKLPESHPCSRLHGHSFKVELAAEGPLDPEKGWFLDFAELEAAWKPLHAQLDHRYLNEVEGLDNPTSEVIAMWIWTRLDDAIPGLQSVAVYDTPEMRCELRRPQERQG